MDLKSTITFIGGGNMARSLINGLIDKGLAPKNVHVVEPNPERAKHLEQDFSINVQTTVDSKVLNVNVVLLAVKPQILNSVCKDLEKFWKNSCANIVSIAAGVKFQSIRLHFENKNSITNKLKIIRAMPNTPALIGLGATGLFSSDKLNSNEIASVESIFNAVGICLWVDSEDKLDTITALSGSGPAYFFSMFEHLITAGIEQGLDPEQAHKLVVQTALGAAQMAKSLPSNNISTLRKNVTSKGGTTEAALKVLTEHKFKFIIQKVIEAAKNRSQELSET